MSFDPVAFIDRAYAPSDDRSAWLHEVVVAIAPVLAPSWEAAAALWWRGDGALEHLVPVDREAGGSEAQRLATACAAAGSPDAAPGLASMGGAPALVARSAGACLSLVVATPRRGFDDASTRRMWCRLATHLGAAMTPAESEATDALRLLHDVMMGRWLVTEQFDEHERRYAVVRRSEEDDAPLSARQQQVLFYASLGWSNKEIGVTLGLAENTVSAHLQRGLWLSGIKTRTELVRFATQIATAARLAGVDEVTMDWTVAWQR